jgi:hypothetical protein
MFTLVKKLASAVANAAAGKATLFIETDTEGPALKDEDGQVMLLAPHCIHIRVTERTVAVSATAGLGSIRAPFKFKVTGVRASLDTAQATGATLTIDINEGGVSILSTLLTFDNTEKTTTTGTPAVISDAVIADDARITVDVDAIGDGTAKGLDVYLIGYPIG